MNPQFLAAAPAIVLTAIILDVLPRRPRRGLYFGITTGSDFALSAGGRALALRYRLVVWIATALALALAFHGFVLVAFPLQIGLGLMGWLRAWRQTSAHAVAPGTLRTAPLHDDPEISSWITPLLLASFLTLALAAAFLYANFESLPARIPTHYGLTGKADAFRNKSLVSVFLPLVIGSLVTALLALNVYGIAYGSRRGGSPENQPFRQAQRRFLTRLLAGLSLAISLLFAYITASPLTSPVGLPGGPWVILTFTLGIVGLSLWAVMRWQEHAGGSGDDTTDDRWKGGLLYYNPDDPALMVERRDGIGYTPNFAHPLAWAMVALVLALIASPFLLRSLG